MQSTYNPTLRQIREIHAYRVRALSENTEIKIEKLNKRNIFTVLHVLSHAGAAGQGGHPLHEGGGRVHPPLGPALLLNIWNLVHENIFVAFEHHGITFIGRKRKCKCWLKKCAKCHRNRKYILTEALLVIE
jgi:hypothetical protein